MYTHAHLHVTTRKSSTVTILLVNTRAFGWPACNSWPLIGRLTAGTPAHKITKLRQKVGLSQFLRELSDLKKQKSKKTRFYAPLCHKRGVISKDSRSNTKQNKI